MLVAEGRRLDIPCIGTGTFLPSIGVPSVHEDNNQGLLLAVQHLVERGHRRIGFVQMPFTLPWVFLRRQAYINALEQCGIEPDEGLVLWLTADDPQRNRELLEKYLDRRRPTALVFGNHGGLMALSALIRSRQLRVPQDVSTIHVDQHPSAGDWLGVRPTCVSIPTQQMGRQIAALARQTIDGRDVPQVTQLPCELTVGASVASLSSQSDNGEAHEENHKT